MNVPIRNQRPGYDQADWAAMIDGDKVCPVSGGCMDDLHLGRHRRSMGFAQRRQFGRPRTHLDSARSVVRNAHVVVHDHGAVVDVVDYGDVDIVDGTVVVEVARIPVPALIADAHITEAVVDSAIETDVRTPVATEPAVTPVRPAPIARSPESALIRSLHPNAGNPIVAGCSIVPVAGRPEIIVSRCGRLLVVRQGRWGLRSVIDGLFTVIG